MTKLGDLDVSRETIRKLEIFSAELKKWNKKINLVAKSTIDDLWTRHFLDSAQLLKLAPHNIETWVDLGSGGGFPGLVVAILFSETRPDVNVVLVESDLRKCAFLNNVIQKTSINAKLISGRIEDISPLNADVISARALAGLDALIDLSERHLSKGGIMLFLKGENWETEVKEAQTRWRFEFDIAKSQTSEKSVILRLSGVRRV